MRMNFNQVWAFAQFLLGHCFGFVWPTSVGTGQHGTTPQQCRTDQDCDTSLGQSCYRLYDGCQVGQCMCDPKRHRQEPSGQCTIIKYGSEPCPGTTDVCQDGMSCIDGYCQCTSGTMTSDRQYCLRPGHQLLGEKCWSTAAGPMHCLHKSSTGYTRYDVRCSTKGTCVCAEGYKADGLTCRRWNMKEFGCTSTFHCQGGAICSKGQCVCPSGYNTAAGNSKCAKRGAIMDLPSGAVCDEINELRYCARSLVCHRCPDEEAYKCVSFLMTSEYAYWSSSGARPGSKWSLVAGHSSSCCRRLQLLLLLLLNVLLTATLPYFIHR